MEPNLNRPKRMTSSMVGGGGSWRAAGVSHTEEVFALRRIRLSPPSECHGRLLALHLRDWGKRVNRAVVDVLVLHLRGEHIGGAGEPLRPACTRTSRSRT